MRASKITAKLAVLAALVGGAWLLAVPAAAAPAEEKPAAQPSRRVVACYFHRTQRCPTCRTIGSYVEEAVNTGFASEIKAGTVSMHFIDFQDEKNKKYTDYYKIEGPTLVLIDVRDGKVKAWKPAPNVWTLVSKKDEFLKYVQDEVRAYLEAK
jgi:hypothetical protein